MEVIVKKNKNIISLFIMILITLITQILTIMKSSIVAGRFGTSIEMDAYNFSNSIVSFLFGFVSSGISTVIIPYYIKENKEKYINTFITILYGIMAIIVIILIIFRYRIVGIFSNKNEYFVNIACNVLLFLLLSNYLYVFSEITVAFFQCKKIYILPKMINLISQLIVIIAIILNKELTIIQYTYIISAGLVINFLLDLIFAIKNKWKYSPCLFFKNSETKKIIKLFLPVVFSTGIYKLSLAVDSIIATRLETGKITILSYSSQIVNMINTVLIGTILNYIYPKIVENLKLKNSQEKFWEQTMFFHIIVCLVISAFVCVGYDAIKLLFQNGNFTSKDTQILFVSTLIYVFGQQIDVIRDLIYRYFYANGNTKVAAQNGMIVGCFNICISLILANFIGFYGIIIGTVLASIISLIVIMKKFSKIIKYNVNIFIIIKDIIIHNLYIIFTVGIVMLSRRFIKFNSLFASIILFGTEVVVLFGILIFIFEKKIFKVVKDI